MKVGALVADVLACLAREHPAANARVRGSLARVRVEAIVDGERVMIAPDDAANAANAAPVGVRTSVETLCRVLLGEADALDEIVADRLELVGAPGDLVSVADAMVAFVEGAMRCVSIETYVDRLMCIREERHNG